MASNAVSIAKIRLERARQRLLEQQIETAEATLVPRADAERVLRESDEALRSIVRAAMLAEIPQAARELRIDEGVLRPMLMEMIEQRLNDALPPIDLDRLGVPAELDIIKKHPRHRATRTPRAPGVRQGKPKPTS